MQTFPHDAPPAFLLEEVPAPTGWTAALLRQPLPVADDASRLAYREAVESLLGLLPPFTEVHPEEVLLQFERLRPGMEIKVLQSHAHFWMPEFGVGVWLDREAPTTWTREEFEAAEPGTLRPVIDRVVRISRDLAAQRSAWRMLLGSGALIRVSAATADRFVAGATGVLLPAIADGSLTSFPFYVPLLRAETLNAPSSVYSQPLEEHLPEVGAYLRESVEDGGLLVLVRESPEAFWKNLQRAPAALDVVRIPSSGQQENTG